MRTTTFDVHPQIPNLIEIRSTLSEAKHAKRQIRTPLFIRNTQYLQIKFRLEVLSYLL
jgi:hypothetical protein